MAAAALTEVRGKKPEVALHAASLALKNLIGLVCDPIGGLVEVPCIKRMGLGLFTVWRRLIWRSWAWKVLCLLMKLSGQCAKLET